MQSKLIILYLLLISTYALGQSFSACGTVRDMKTSKAVVGAIIQMIGSGGSVVAVKSDTGGHYVFDSTKVKPNASYFITSDATKLDYEDNPAKAIVTTIGVGYSKTFVNDFVLKRKYHRDGFPVVMFKKNKAIVTKGSIDTVLIDIVKLLNDNPTIIIQIDGHSAPNEGCRKKKLSFARAQACMDYLVSQGIDAARIHITGWSDKQPLMGNAARDIRKMKTKADKEVARAIDRRVEFRVFSFDYKPKQ